MDEGHTADDIYLAKDFYSVNSRFLLAIMKSFGQGDAVVRWIEPDLSGRVARVPVGGEHMGAILMRNVQHSLVSPSLELLLRCPRSTGIALCG